MPSNTVAQFAVELKLAPQLLLQQLRAAGVAKSSEDDPLTEDDKSRLLASLQRAHGEAEAPQKKKITLTRKSTSEIKQADGSGKARTIQVEVRKKRVFVKRDEAGVEEAAPAEVPLAEPALPVIDEAERERREEEARRAAELAARQMAEARERAEVAQRELREAAARQQQDLAEAQAKEAAARAEVERMQAEQEAARRADEAARAEADRRRRAVEAEVAAINTMRSTPARVVKAPEPAPAPAAAATTGTLHKPAARTPAKPGEGKKDEKKPGVKEVKSGKLASSWSEDAAKKRALKTRGDTGGASGWRGGPRGHRKGEDRGERGGAPTPEAAAPVVRDVTVPETITVADLAHKMSLKASEVIKVLMKLGQMVTINQVLDQDTAMIVVTELGHSPIAAKLDDPEALLAETETTAAAEVVEEPRPPVVTIMGHVDHGKTSLLDYIRKANVVAGEAGGITQHIGAYHVTTADGRRLTFLDTPGHEAFTAMRARGAQVTDIVVLVVAADDSVMPQTIEAISHAKNAGVPMIVAINKCDLPQANPMKVKQELLQHSVVLEEFGGTTLSSEISAKTGAGVPELLEQILLQSELLELKANPTRMAQGAVIEAQLDPGRGPVATVLVETGTLRVGDDFICGLFSGRVRALLDERGKNVKEAGPAIPVQVLGLSGVPMAGDQFVVVEDAEAARDLAQRRERLEREAKSRRQAKGAMSLEDFMAAAGTGERRTLKLLIKADQGGPAEALADSLQGLSNAEVAVEVIQRSVGAVTESDILLAKTAGAIIIGFHVRPDAKARAAADREGVEIKLYRIIYEAVADVRAALEGMLRPEEKEVVLGEAEVREIFKVKSLVIAGCGVRSGVINRTGRIRVVRDGKEIYDGAIGSLRRFKDDVKEVKEGFECGIGVENFNDLKVGDVLECYKKEEVARTLETAGQAG